MKTRIRIWPGWPLIVFNLALAVLLSRTLEADSSVSSQTNEPETDSYIYLPAVAKPPASICPISSSNQYSSGTAFQFDLDNPVRPAFNHADKNLALRGYVVNRDSGLKRQLIDYGSDDPNQPPQLASLFQPDRVPGFKEFYQVRNWNWALSPNPGSRGGPITSPKVTAMGLTTTPGETLHVPRSAYDIGGGMEVVILYADEDTVTLRYTREDSSGSAGYTLHVDGICTDLNLLSLYNSLDNPSGPRYDYKPPNQRPYGYPLPNLRAGQVFGYAPGHEIVVAIVDSGAFQDPRSCNEWWQVRPGYGSCN
jgi:hypothetical protein